MRLHRGERDEQGLIAAAGLDPARSWHYAFAAAGVGMLVGLAIYLKQSDRLPRTGESKAEKKAQAEAKEILTREEGSASARSRCCSRSRSCSGRRTSRRASLNLFAKRLVSTNLFGWEFPASWLQSLTPCYVILLAPVFARLWIQLGDRQPPSARKSRSGCSPSGSRSAS